MADALPLWRRSVAGLVPADAAAQERFEALRVGDVVRCKPTKMRNEKFHRKFFALLNLCLKNADGWTDESLFDYLKIQTGHFTPMTFPAAPGYVFRKPKSISWASMDAVDFEKFFNAAINVMLKDVVPHIPEAELRDAVELELVMA